MTSTVQQLAARGQQLLVDSEDGIKDATLESLASWLNDLQQVLHQPGADQSKREDLELILSVNDAIMDRVQKNRDELSTSIKQTRTGINAVKAYQGKS